MPTRRDANIAAGKVLRHQVQIFRASTTLVGLVKRRLLTVRGILLRELAAWDPTEPSRLGDRLNRLDAMYSQVRPTLAAEFRKVNKTVQRELAELALADQRITGAVFAELGGVAAITPLPRAVMLRTIERAAIEGAPSATWWKKQGSALADRFRNQIRQGMDRGETVTDLIKRVRGTQQRGYADGIMAVSFRDAENLVRSSVMSALNAVRVEQARRTDGVIGQQLLTAFDDRVCQVCMALSGGIFDMDGRRIKGSGPDMPTSSPPLHFSCRCTVVMVFEDQPAADDLSFEDWLREQPEAEQREILGDGRHELWAQGAISLRDLIDQRGRPLSIAELRNMGKKEAA